MDAMIEKATRNSSAPDPRLASEEELRAFLEMLRPEDLDVSSPAFKELPTEVQYEIIGDLRLKSRQTSHLRLQAMLRDSRTPLDFSRAQIVNLKQRNALTQQLLETTDSIGKANVTIPVRIASERNKEYLLVKNEGEEGGWVLGIRDEGTQDKPIVIETDESTISEADSESDDMDMEEVAMYVSILFFAYLIYKKGDEGEYSKIICLIVPILVPRPQHQPLTQTFAITNGKMLWMQSQGTNWQTVCMVNSNSKRRSPYLYRTSLN